MTRSKWGSHNLPLPLSPLFDAAGENIGRCNGLFVTDCLFSQTYLVNHIILLSAMSGSNPGRGGPLTN